MSAEAAAAGTAPGAPARLPARARAYLADPALAGLWQRVRSRLEDNRLAATGVLTLPLDERGAELLAGLLGAPVAAGRVRVRLPALDEALRHSVAAAGLVSVVAELTGPLVDRSAAREAKARDRARVWAALDAALAAAGLADAGWVPGFLEALRRSGLLTRAGDATAAAAAARCGAVLVELAPALAGPAPAGEPVWELAALASRCTGTAHGLDEGHLSAALVLRAAAAALAVPVPDTAAERRGLWERLGVSPDQISGTVITWGLRPPGDDPWSTTMRARAEQGLVTHLCTQELRAPAAAAATLAGAGAVVFACENPQVLQAAARAGSPAPLVCFSGNPALAGWLLLRRLVAEGAAVRYHGDFDWAGMAIAGRVLDAGATPWRLGAADYEAAVAALPGEERLALAGTPVGTGWDPALAAALRRHEVAVHEEALLAVLLADLG